MAGTAPSQHASPKSHSEFGTSTDTENMFTGIISFTTIPGTTPHPGGGRRQMGDITGLEIVTERRYELGAISDVI